MTSLGTKTPRPVRRLPTVVRTLQRVTLGHRRGVLRTAQLVVRAVPNAVAEPIDVQALAVAAHRLRGQAVPRAAAQLGVLVRHVDRAKLLDHAAVRIAVAGPAPRDALVRQLALELLVLALVGFIWRSRKRKIIDFVF